MYTFAKAYPLLTCVSQVTLGPLVPVCLIFLRIEDLPVIFTALGLPRWRRGRAFASHAGDRGSIPGRDRPES